MLKRSVSKALLGIIAGLAPAAASAQQPYYPDPVPLNRPAPGVEGAAYMGAPPGNGMMPANAQGPMAWQPPAGARPADPNLLPPPRALPPGAPAPMDPSVDLSPNFDAA